MSDPRTLLFVVDGFNLGGAECTLLRFIRSINDRYRILVYSTGHEGPLLEAYREHCAAVFSHPKQHAFDVSQLGRLRGVIRDENPDLVVSVLFYADVIAGLACRGLPVPLASWLHVVPSRDIRNRRWYHFLAYRLAQPRMNRVICCAECVRQDLLAVHHPREQKVVTVHNGVDTERFAFHPPREDDGEFRIGVVARFFLEKGHRYILRAMPKIIREIPRARLFLVGDGPIRPAMEELAAELNISQHVLFTGERSDVEAIYPEVDVVALPSDAEAHPISILEGMACGRPVVASDLPGTRESLDETCGMFVPPADIRHWVKTLVQLGRDRERQTAMGQAARLRVEEHFEIQKQHQRLEQALLETLSS